MTQEVNCMKKLLSLFLSICLLVQLTAPAFAAETARAGGASAVFLLRGKKKKTAA